MTILALSGHEYAGDALQPGAYYHAEKAERGTLAQNKAFHALLQEYWASGCHSYPARNFLHFRELIKLYLGAGVEKYLSLADEAGRALPGGRVSYRVKRWRDYTKRERAAAMDHLIAGIMQAGAMTAKMREIIAGMELKSEGEYMINLKNTPSAKAAAYRLLDRFWDGKEFRGIDLARAIDRATGEVHYPDTYLRYVRMYRRDTGRRIVCVKRSRSLYRMEGRE